MVGSSAGREVAHAFLHGHQVCDFRPKLLPFLVPAPFIDLRLAEARLPGNLKQRLLGPVGVPLELPHESLELVA